MTRTQTRVCSRCNIRRSPSSFTSAKGRICNKCKSLGTRRASRELRLKQTYGITLHEYDAILATQNGACGGCGGVRRYNLHVDHDHKIETHLLGLGFSVTDAARQSVRGLLCARCNKVLRDTRDSTAVLQRLAGYLQLPPARPVLGKGGR